MTGLTGADRSFFYAGGPPPNSEAQISLDFKGGALINQAVTGRARPEDAIDSYLLKGMPYGRDRSEANKPTLESPLMNFRVLTKEFQKENTQFLNTFDALKNRLPEELKSRLNEEMALPPAERSPIFSGLNQTLSLTAMLIIWLKQASNPDNMSTNALRMALLNLNLTSQATQQLLEQMEVFLREGFALMRRIGANHPDYDRMLKFLAEAQEAFKLMKQISDEEERQKKRGAQGESEDTLQKKRQQIQAIVNKIHAIHRNYHHTVADSEMQILGTLLNALSIVAQSQTLDQGLRSVLWGLLVAHTGDEKGTSQAQSSGKAIQKVLQTLSKLLFYKYHQEAHPGLEQFYPLFLSFNITLILTSTLYFLDIDAESKPEDETNPTQNKLKVSKETQLTIQAYTLMNLIEMFLEIDLMEFLMFDSNKKNEAPAKINAPKQAAECIVLGLILKTIRQQDPELSLLLLSGFSSNLESRIHVLEEALHTVNLSSDHENTLSKESLERAVLKLAECRVNLRKNELPRYYQAYDAFLAAFCENIEALDEDLTLFRELSHAIKRCFTRDYKDFSNSITGVVQI